MRRIVKHLRNVATWGYRKLPDPVKDLVSAAAHGETRVQAGVSKVLQDARVRVLGAEGSGEALTGGVLNTRHAVLAERFDCWAHLAGLEDIVLSAFAEGGVTAYQLPNQPRPTIVVGSNDWERAWHALRASSASSTLWARGAKFHSSLLGMKSTPDEGSVWVFQYLVAPDGQTLANDGLRIRLVCWERVTELDVPRADGGFYEPGTLLGHKTRNSFASYLSPSLQAKLADRDQVRAWPPKLESVTEPVDLVYTWVDGSDPAWAAKRAKHRGVKETSPDGNVAARYESHDELRYSFRSVEMYASWVRKIYLVTDQQIPAWLNLDHPKLEVIDHSQIFDLEHLPVFNSHAIESRLHRIPGLSEHFIYMNDDVFFGRPVRPETFYVGNRITKYFPSRSLLDADEPSISDVSVTSAAKNNRALIEKTCGVTVNNKLKHTPHAHLRSVLEELEQTFSGDFARVAGSRFRSHTDIAVLSGLAQRYGEATGRTIVGTVRYNYADVSRRDLNRLLARWLRNRSYDVFCLNDTGINNVDETERNQILADFLSSYFPVPSAFEK